MLKVVVEGTQHALEEEVDADIQAFQAWFQSIGNEALSRPEAAILKTYLYFKTKVKTDGP